MGLRRSRGATHRVARRGGWATLQAPLSTAAPHAASPLTHALTAGRGGREVLRPSAAEPGIPHTKPAL